MAVTSISEYLYDLNVYWAKKRPENTFDEAGKLAMMLSKMPKSDWTGEKIARVPMKTKLNGNIGASYTKNFQNAGSGGGQRFETPLRDLFAIMKIDADALEIGGPGATSGGQSIKQEEIKTTTDSWMRMFSTILWSDGTGRIAKGDGAYSVAGTTIYCLNEESVSGFEEGDVIVLIDQGAAVPSGGMPTPRAGTLTVTGIQDESSPYFIEVDAAVNTIVGATNTDFISKDVFFAGKNGMIDGVFRYIPITTTGAQQSLFGVDRSKNTRRVSGSRVKITGNETSYQIVALMGAKLKKARGGEIKPNDRYVLFVPSSEITALMADAKQSGIDTTETKTPTSVKHLVLGTKVVTVQWPGLGEVAICVDHRLHDPYVATADDRTYVLLNLAQWRYGTGRTGISWKKYEDTGGMVKNIPGTDEYYAEYGAKGNLFCFNPSHNVVASTRVS